MDAVTLPSVTFADAWQDARRLLPPGWRLLLEWRGPDAIAVATNGMTRRWSHGATEIEALERLADVLLDEIATGIG